MNRKHQRQATTEPQPAAFPSVPSDLLGAIAHLRAGRLDEAKSELQSLVAADPESWQGLHLLGLVCFRQGQLQDAATLIRGCLQVNPNLAEAYSDLGVVMKDLGEFDDAQAACERAIAIKPEFHPAHSNLGNIYKAQGQLQDAAACYRRAVEIAPAFADGHANLAAVLIVLGEFDEALMSAQRAVDLAPAHVEALLTLGHALRAGGILGEAMAVYHRAIELRPDFGPAYSDLGCVLQEAGHLADALRLHERAVALKPDYAEGFNNLGITLKHLGRYADAMKAYETALRLKPNYADAYSNLGVVLGSLERHGEAVAAYRKAVQIEPRMMLAYINMAGTLWDQKQLGEAIATYAKALTIEPNQPNALVDHYNLCRHACDWDGLAASEEKILTSTYRQGKRVAPFPILNIQCSAEDHLLSARAWAAKLPRGMMAPFTYAPPRSASPQGKLRIGYLSADFYRHATTSLIAELIERHDRSRFEVFGYCFSRDDGSEMRRRLIAAFDRFNQLGQLSHGDAARRIHQDGIDILIDLKGYTTDARTEILASRPAPIQVNYLGYPGTMGADFIDYVIADDFILPMDQQPFFDEKIVQLPGCYQPNDTKRLIAPVAPSRAQCGLPENAFVFCCFNNSYKITPQLFAVWMRLLKAVPGSVLWLLEANSLVRDNLQRKAVSAGVDPARLIFAPKAELAVHLARHRHADLFLDTLPVNAHTTASDALWAGLPVLTCAGESFVARVCGSLLRAVGLPELITTSLEQYEAAALDLARNPARLMALRDRLAASRSSAPLFDIGRYTQGLEAAFEHMAEIRAAGLGPRAFAVNMAEAPDDALPPLEPEPELPPPPVAAAEAAKAPARPAPGQSLIAFEACPLCDASDIPIYKDADCTRHPHYQPELPPKLNWCRCRSCGHLFTQSYLSPDAAAALHARPAPYQSVGHELEAQRVHSARIVASVARHQTSGDWLDVGFGSASLMFTAQEWGFRVSGLDMRGENAETLRALGYEAHAMPIEACDLPRRFNVISMADVLENTPFPRQALEAAHRHLKPKGALFVTLPNMDTIIWRMMDGSGRNPYWGEIGQYHQFTRERLYWLLHRCGFEPVSYNISERHSSCMEVIALKT